MPDASLRGDRPGAAEAAGARDDQPSSPRGGRRRGAELPPIERLAVSLSRRAVHSKTLDPASRWLVRNIGARWVNALAKPRLHVLGLSRLPSFDDRKSYILASNHRSYFDMFVITAYLMRERGLRQRVTYPVRSEFIYDNPAGFLLNGGVTFFTMYPPIWRDRRRMSHTMASIRDMTELLAGGDWVIGMHPEGTRSKDPDPYVLLPAHSGIGRIAVESRVPVIPVFIHGIGNDFPREVVATARKESPIFITFGEPLQPEEASGGSREKVYTAMTQRVMAAIKALGEEEREARAAAGLAAAGAGGPR